MRLLFAVLLCFSFLQISCDNSIDYIGDFNQQYSLNCVLRSDKDVQYATIKRSYPPGNEFNQANVQDAEIKLILPDTTLFFRDTVISNQLNTHVSYVYYLKNFILPKNTYIRIEAVLPDYTTLYAETKSAQYSTILLETEELSLPGTADDAVFYTWRTLGQRDSLLLIPSIYIRYFILGQDTAVKYKKIDGTYFINTGTYKVTNYALSLAMNQISDGIPDKSSINILNACLEIKLCDTMLGMYAAASQTFEDEFSVRISETDFTNINGGYGIFGTYISETFDLPITPEYINSFGYTLAH